MKTQTQEITEYIKQLEELFKQSEVIKREIKRHSGFSHFRNRIGGIKQQLEFIRHHTLPLSHRDKVKYFKHNKLALKLINRHIDEIERECGETRLKRLAEEEAEWELIESLREQTRKNIEHIEAVLHEMPLDMSENAPIETQDIALFGTEVAELAEKTELILKELESHGGLFEPLFEQIHHLHNEVQFIHLHDYARFPFHMEQHEHLTFLGHHYDALTHVNEHLQHMLHQWDHIEDSLTAENEGMDEIKQIQEEIRHTVEQLSEKLEHIEEDRLHYIQHPDMKLVHIKTPYKKQP